MTGWRICRRRYAGDPISGRGALRRGGRWNDPGVGVVYASDSLALAALETFVNIQENTSPDDLVYIQIDISEDMNVHKIDDWTVLADLSIEGTRRMGNDWILGQWSPVMLVPSMVIPVHRNILLNPGHPEIARVTTRPPQPFLFDPRMWRSR